MADSIKIPVNRFFSNPDTAIERMPQFAQELQETVYLVQTAFGECGTKNEYSIRTRAEVVTLKSRTIISTCLYRGSQKTYTGPKTYITTEQPVMPPTLAAKEKTPRYLNGEIVEINCSNYARFALANIGRKFVTPWGEELPKYEVFFCCGLSPAQLTKLCQNQLSGWENQPKNGFENGRIKKTGYHFR